MCGVDNRAVWALTLALYRLQLLLLLSHSQSQAGARLWQNVPETRRPESQV